MHVRAYKKAQAVMCRFICTRQMIKVLRRTFTGTTTTPQSPFLTADNVRFAAPKSYVTMPGLRRKTGYSVTFSSRKAKEACRCCSFCGQPNGGEPFRRRRQWFLAAVHRLLFSPISCGSSVAVTHSRRDYILSETQHPCESASLDRVTRFYILRSPQGTYLTRVSFTPEVFLLT